MTFKLLHSPLAGTAGVLTALGLLAIPLHHLTAYRQLPPHPPHAILPHADRATPAVLRLKLLTPARSLRIATEDHLVLLNLANVPAGESEYDLALTIPDDTLDLLLTAEFANTTADTAVFLTAMPDGLEGRTCYAIGCGMVTQPLRFNWHHH